MPRHLPPGKEKDWESPSPPPKSGHNFAHATGANGSATFSNRESLTLFHCNRGDQIDFYRHVVPRHHHFHSLRQRYGARHVRSAEIKLRSIIRKKWGMPTPFFFR